MMFMQKSTCIIIALKWLLICKPLFDMIHDTIASVSCMFVHINNFYIVCSKYCLSGDLCNCAHAIIQAGYTGKRSINIAYFLVLYCHHGCPGGPPHE